MDWMRNRKKGKYGYATPFLDLMHPMIDCVKSSVTSSINTTLCAPFTYLDVKTALFDMNPDKLSLVPDGRLISDNIILGFETMYWIRNRKKGKYGYAGLKLHMSKEYDRVEWKFLETVILKMGFCTEWIDKIMRCISSIRYSFSLNNQGLSSMLMEFEVRERLMGVRIASRGPATDEYYTSVAECLGSYERASGEVINFEKSDLSFTPNTKLDVFERIRAALTIPVVQGHEVYLGLPTFSLRSKKFQFWYLVERVSRRIKGWERKFFSIGGKEILIKSAAGHPDICHVLLPYP
ncbi:uncharacterized protein [Henckelia pumila]|uniref:uncharacterized protein n=1 Tax=Henckelia pumila TaxID=405737 RepID=UPI003C6E389D